MHGNVSAHTGRCPMKDSLRLHIRNIIARCVYAFISVMLIIVGISFTFQITARVATPPRKKVRMAEGSEGLSVPQLMEDLADVIDWHSLGTHLGLETSQLDVIEQEIPAGVGAVQRRKGRVLDTWMKGKTGDPSWRDVVSALMKMGGHSIAERMRRKYSGSMPVKPAVSEAVVIAQENQQQIKGEFVKLQMLVCEKLQTKQINMQRFLYFIKGLFQCIDFIPASKKIDDIFEAITRNGLWDFINYSPLRQIAKAFARDDEEINTAIHKYQSALAGYLAGTKIAQHIASMSPFSEGAYNEDEPLCARMDKRYFNKLTFKLKAKVTEESLDYLIELWDSLSRYLCLPSLTYLLDEIRVGCISVTWLIPPTAMPVIVLKIDDSETAEEFSKLGIIRMEVDDMCLYEEQEQSVKSVDTATYTEQKQEQDSSHKKFSHSQEQVQTEFNEGVAKRTTKHEQELLQHAKDKVTQKTGSTKEKTRKLLQRMEEENGELRVEIACKEEENRESRKQIIALKYKLNQTQEESEQLREQLQQTTLLLAEKSTLVCELERARVNMERDLQSRTSTFNKPVHQIVAEGRGLLYGEINQTAKFQVHLTACIGEPCVERQVVRAELKSLLDGSITQAEVSYQTGSVGSYEVSYQPSIRGRHELSVLVNDESIAGSPFRVYVQQPPQLMGQPVRVIRGLSGPWRGTFSSSGQLIVTEAGGISIFDGQGELVRRIDSVELKHSRVMLYPTGVAIDDNGTMYVCDEDAHKLFKVSSTGKVLKSVGGRGNGQVQFDWPDGIALRDNKLYVCHRRNHRIQIFTCDLNFISSFGSHGDGEGEFSFPRDIAFDQEGNMYVAEFGNDRVQVFSSTGTFLRVIGKHGSESGELSGPCGIHVDHNIVYVAEWYNDRISAFTTLGEFVTSFGKQGWNEGEFSGPLGITMDSDGFLHACDCSNGRIQVY